MFRYFSIRTVIFIRQIVRVFVFSCFLCVLNAFPADAALYINEFMSSNSAGIFDEDSDSSDWIELYNQSDTWFNLSGYGISDNPGNPFKWTFPAYTMEPGEYLLVFASGKDRKNTAQFHTNFKIAKEGESLVLTKPGGTITDSLYTVYLRTDVSRGRIPDGSSELYLFTAPSPGAPNNSSGYAGYADSVAFSRTGGFYDYAVSVELSVPSPDTKIYYSLDSSEPTESSYLYNGTLSFSSTRVLRARAYESGKLPGSITTATYIIGYNRPETEVAEYFITCTQEDFDYLYAHYSEDDYLPATITFEGKTWNDVGIRIRGDDARALSKKSLKLRFDSELFADGRDRLNLNAEWLDKSYMSQYLSSRLMREAGHPAFSSEHARVYLNGKYLGLYLKIENVDEYFLEANGLDPEGNLYKATVTDACLSMYDNPDSTWEKKTNGDTGIDDLVEFIERINSEPDISYYYFARDAMDYGKMVNMIALNMLVANGSTYYHNYFMYHDINVTGKWMMFPWDMDKTMGNRYTYEYSYLRSTSAKRSDNPFHKRAIINESILSDIQARINELSVSVFDPGYVISIIDSLETALETSVSEDKTDDINNSTTWKNTVEERRKYVRNRSKNLIYQFENYPRPFSVLSTPDTVIQPFEFVWHPSTDPNGDTIRYTITYADNTLFSGAIEITDIVDTTYTLPFDLPPDTYYWKVRATDGSDMLAWYDNSYLCEGFNHRNVFTVLDNSKIPDDITGDIVLTEPKSPYYVTGDITVHPEGSLTIEPGVELIISENVNIFVHGRLTAAGTEEKPVVFRPSSDAVRWGAICFENAAGLSSITNAVIEEASQGEDPVLYRSAVSAQSTNLLLEHVRFTGNLQSVYTADGDLTVRYCIFEDTNSGQHVDASGGTAVVEYSEFHNSDAGDAIDYNNVTGGSVSFNTIYASPDDGIDIGSGSGDINIIGNKVYNCSDKGISIGEISIGIDISHNIVTLSSIGIAVKDSSVASIDHNTLYRNNTSISAYKSDHTIPYGGFVAVTNTIISLSGTASVSTDDISSIDVSYSLSDKELILGDGNIYASADFISPEENDFGLRKGSPAIGHGIPDGDDPSDIGAVPYSAVSAVDGISDISIHESFVLGQNYPNPFNPVTTIPITVAEPGRVTVEVYSILGQHVETLIDDDMTTGIYTVMFNSGNLPAGVYIYLIKSGDYAESKQMLLLK